MEYVISIAGFLVSVFTVLAYIKSTFKGSVYLIVQPTFRSINDTLKNVDRTMTKLNTIVDTIVDKQHQFDKDMLVMQRDVTKLNTIAEEITNRQHVIDTDFALMNQSLATLHGRQDEFEDKMNEFNDFCKNHHGGK